MNTYEVITYSEAHSEVWNNFVAHSKNGTFLFHRDFMDYHQDRFEDYSQLIFEDSQLIAVFPANKFGNTIYSHQGLTYGGLVLLESIKFNEVLSILKALLQHFKKQNFNEIQIKCIPQIYTKQASNELAYLLLQMNAEIFRRDIEMAIDFSQPLQIHKTKLKHFHKAEAFEIIETDDCSQFWSKVLEPKLKDKYQSKPVHTVSEIQLLKNKFKNNIHQFDVYFEKEIVAGITLFEKDHVVKSQYGAATPKGEKLRALEYLFIYLINKYKTEGKQFFSMGTVNKTNELGYNEGLLKQKEELGCSLYIQDFYKLKI